MTQAKRQSRALEWGGALLILLITQSLFWAVVGIAERAARPAGMEMRPDVHFVLYDKIGEQISGGWELKADRDDYRGYRAAGSNKAHHAVFSILFTVEDKDKALALFLESRELIDEVSLNGMPIQPERPLRRLTGNISLDPALYPLPSRYLQNGTNVIYAKTLAVDPQIFLPPFAIGAADSLESAYRMRSMLGLDIPITGVAILMFTIALCLIVNWPLEDRLRMRWLIAFLSLNVVSTLILTFVPAGANSLISTLALVACNVLLGISAVRYAMLDALRGGHWHYWIAGAATLAAAAAAILPEHRIPLTRLALLGSNAAAVALSLSAALLLARRTAHRAMGQWLERSVLILCLTALAVDRLTAFFGLRAPLNPDWPISLYWAPIAGPLLGIGLLLSLARQAGEARREVAQSNEILAARLSEQDAALSRSYDAQKQMLQRQVMLEERQRIVRDMHDGIGGQLLGLMLQVRQGGVENKQVEEGLQSSIADLRLIVDSMDGAEDGLAETMRSFEHRVRAQVEAAGLAFKAEHGLDVGKPGPGPRPTLQILRILQEAVTNAMRHSGGSEILLQSSEIADGMIRVAVSDNGKGLPAEIKGGRGLMSMRSRAEAVGGILDVQSGAGGTILSLTLPAPS